MTEPSFSENFIETLDVSAVEKPRYWDVKIILSDDPMKPEYYLHKVILAAKSSFFRKLFYHEPKKVYEIGMVSKRGFENVVEYIYNRRMIRVLNEEDFDDIQGQLKCARKMEQYLLYHHLVQVGNEKPIAWFGKAMFLDLCHKGEFSPQRNY